ncbi:hypothetical protein Pst134EB_029891 [Puccinia striiformis f. sp. tritici]|nr:hypothetical protein Pst134EB_029891 [Puccinia striiformis f. sp. tritici]
MLQFLRWIALVVVIASCRAEEPSDDTYFGCFKHVDAICSIPIPEDPHKQRLIWAQRLHPKKRHYRCSGKTVPLCCGHNEFDISGNTDEELKVSKDATSGCVTGGQLKTRR